MEETLLRKLVIAAMIIVVDEMESATQLAEHASHSFGHDEWLNNETHWIWDEAMEVYLSYFGEGN